MSVWSMAAAVVMAGATGISLQAAQVAQPARPALPAPAVTVVAQPANVYAVSVPATAWATQEDEQKVSASFNHAAVSDVLDWLTKQGVSFVTADSELPKDATITLNVKDQPLNEVVDAIANALGGHWSRRGDMRVFRKGEEFGGFGGDGENFVMPKIDGMKTWNIGPDAKAWTTDPGKFKVFTDEDGPFKVFRDKDGQFKVFGDKDGKTFVMPEMPNMPDMPEIKEWSMPDLEKLHGQLKGLPGMDKQAQVEMERAFAKARDEMAKSGDEMKISKKAMEEARKEMEKARKEHPEAFNGRIFISPDAKAFGKGFSGNGKTFVFKRGGPAMTFEMQDFSKFMSSISPDQKELNRRQGYLKLSDLTENQRKMLGISGKEKDLTIKISKDGQDITIKSND